MRTPKEFNDNLKNKIITKDMLGACLYSVNKRAKNYRDQLRRYHKSGYLPPYRSGLCYGYDIYEESIKKQINKYYEKKDILLKLISPTCVHHNSYGEYFLFYDLDTYSFHSPIKRSELAELNYKIIEIGKLETHGEDVDDLISCQFVDKILDLVATENYSYVG